MACGGWRDGGIAVRVSIHAHTRWGDGAMGRRGDMDVTSRTSRPASSTDPSRREPSFAPFAHHPMAPRSLAPQPECRGPWIWPLSDARAMCGVVVREMRAPWRGCVVVVDSVETTTRRRRGICLSTQVPAVRSVHDRCTKRQKCRSGQQRQLMFGGGHSGEESMNEAPGFLGGTPFGRDMRLWHGKSAIRSSCPAVCTRS